jgi:ABC-type sugar transport system ATPase subunit
MGNEQLIYLSLANQTLIARRPPADTVEIGNEIGVSFLKNKIIFIQQNGEII